MRGPTSATAALIGRIAGDVAFLDRHNGPRFPVAPAPARGLFQAMYTAASSCSTQALPGGSEACPGDRPARHPAHDR